MTSFNTASPTAVNAPSTPAANSQWSWSGHVNPVSTASSQASTVPGAFFTVLESDGTFATANNTSQSWSFPAAGSAEQSWSTASPSGSSHSWSVPAPAPPRSNAGKGRNPGNLPEWILSNQHQHSTSWENVPLTSRFEQSADAETFAIGTPPPPPPSEEYHIEILPSARSKAISKGSSKDKANSERSSARIRNSANLASILALEDQNRTAALLEQSDADVTQAFPWWPAGPSSTEEESAAQYFHARTRLGDNREGLLVDVGAIGNLVGSEWVERQTRLAANHGLSVSFSEMERPLVVEGVGKSSQSTNTQATIPIATSQGSAIYTAPVIPQSGLPALLGLESIESKGGLLDTKMRKLVFPGPGGLEIRCSPNTVIYDLEKAPSGHLLLPVSEFGRNNLGPAPGHTAFFSQAGQSSQNNVYVMMPVSDSLPAAHGHTETAHQRSDSESVTLPVQPVDLQPAASNARPGCIRHAVVPASNVNSSSSTSEPHWPPGLQDSQFQPIRTPLSANEIRLMTQSMLNQRNVRSQSGTQSSFPASSSHYQ